MQQSVPILMYHRIVDDGPDSLSQWRVSPSELDCQLRFLKANGYSAITSDDWLSAVTGTRRLPPKPVMITFDDGYQDFAELAWPLLQQHGFASEVFIVTDKVGGVADWDAKHGPPAPLMSWSTIQALSSDGVRFSSHLASHRALRRLSPDEILVEGRSSRRKLEDCVGYCVEAVAWPFGNSTESAILLLQECGFRVQFGVKERVAMLSDSLRDLPRIQISGGDSLSFFSTKIGHKNEQC